VSWLTLAILIHAQTAGDGYDIFLGNGGLVVQMRWIFIEWRQGSIFDIFSSGVLVVLNTSRQNGDWWLVVKTTSD
jgi:hypothetical protein